MNVPVKLFMNGDLESRDARAVHIKKVIERKGEILELLRQSGIAAKDLFLNDI